MKILLLTDIPPDRSLTAGLVLDRLCRFLPSGSVACFAVVNPTVDTRLSEDLPGVPTMFVDKPREDGLSGFGKRGSPLRSIAERFRGFHDRNFAVPSLVNKAARFARQQKVEAVWAVLQGQTMIHMARPLARKLGVPLFTLVWDPLSWWLKSFEVEPHSAKLAKREFDKAIMSSRAVATASWAMTAEYDKKYRVFSVPVIASHDRAVARQPEPRIRTDGELVIGMAGQFYARGEWDQLIIALNACNWKIGDRHVRINVAGHHLPHTDAPAGKITKLGWLAHPELVKRLSECDILYCPYPYDREMDEVSRLSFPSKLVAYLAAGRPTVFHGPRHASPGRYIAETGSGLVALGPQASAIYNVIERLTLTPDLYKQSAENAQRAFLRDFTFETMRRNFFEFLRISDPGIGLSLSQPGDGVDAGPPGSAAESPPSSEILDKRSPRRRQKRLKLKGRSGDGWKLRLLRRSRYVRNLEARVAELGEWQQVHSKELTGLYSYVKQLTEKIASQSSAADRQMEEAANALMQKDAEIHSRRDELRRHISIRDAIAASLVQAIEKGEGERRQLIEETQRLDGLIVGSHASSESDRKHHVSSMEAAMAEVANLREECARRQAVADELSATLQQVMRERGDAIRQRDEVAFRSHEDALGLQQSHIDLECQLQAVMKDSSAGAAAARATITRLEAELADAHPNAKRASSLLVELQIARATLEERASALVVAQHERDDIARRYDADMFAAEEASRDKSRRILELEQQLAQEAVIAADLESTKRTLAREQDHLSRLMAERDEILSRVSAESVSLKRNMAVLKAGYVSGQNQLVRVFGKLSEEVADFDDAGQRQVNTSSQKLYLGMLAEVLSTRDEDVFGRIAETAMHERCFETIEALVENALNNGVSGDFADLGSAGDASAIYIGGVLKVHGHTSRKVWAITTHAELPRGNVINYPADRIVGVESGYPRIGQRGFTTYGLADDQIRVLDSATDEALTKGGMNKLAFIHLHADGPESLGIFGSLYKRLSKGGSVFVSASKSAARRALVAELRKRFNVEDEIREVDGAGVCWTLPSAEAPTPRPRTSSSPDSKGLRHARPSRRRQSS